MSVTTTRGSVVPPVSNDTVVPDRVRMVAVETHIDAPEIGEEEGSGYNFVSDAADAFAWFPVRLAEQREERETDCDANT